MTKHLLQLHFNASEGQTSNMICYYPCTIFYMRVTFSMFLKVLNVQSARKTTSSKKYQHGITNLWIAFLYLESQ